MKLLLLLVFSLGIQGLKANTSINATQKVLIIVPNNTKLLDNTDTIGFDYLSSLIDSYSIFKNNGIQVEFASPKGGAISISKESLDEIYNYGAVAYYYKTENIGNQLKNTIALKDVNPSHYNAVYCIGGRTSIADFYKNDELHSILRQVYENNGVVAAVDNAVSALINVKLNKNTYLLKGKKVTSFTNKEMVRAYQVDDKESLLKQIEILVENEVEKIGGIYEKANEGFEARVVNNNRIVTGGFALSCASTVANEIVSLISKPKKRILIVVTSNDKLIDGSSAGFYLPEVTDFHYVLSNGGDFEFDIASPKGGKAPMYNDLGFLNDGSYKKYLLETGLLIKLYNTIPLSEINPDEYAAVHFAGGFAALTDFPSDTNLKNVIKNIYENNGVVSAVCHGPSALLNVKLSNGKYLLDGKKVTSRTVEEETYGGGNKKQVLKIFPIILEDEIRKQKAIFTKGQPFQGYIESDQRVVTGQGVPSTTPLAKEVLKQLNTTKNKAH